MVGRSEMYVRTEFTTATSSVSNTASHVDITGRLGAHVRTRELPSGDALTSFTVIVDRPAREQHGTAKVDAIGCTASNRKRAERIERMERMEPGMMVTIVGVLRRRFWRAGAQAGRVGSTTEVLVRSARKY